MKIRYSLIFAVLALLLNGCFSAISKSAGAWNGDTSVAPQAVALDVATAPVQAPFWIIAGVGHIVNRNKPEEERIFRTRFLEDDAFRREFIQSRNLKPHNLDFLMYEDMAGALSADEVRYLWKRFRDIATGMRNELLISSRNTPPDVLSEYYFRVLEQAERREGRPSPHDLVYHQRLLLHPNLPADIVSEIRSYSIDSLSDTLNRRKEPNQALQRMNTLVTDRAPSSTLRAKRVHR